ncbi:TIGR01212 family radical SAM protein [Lagierella massiliensis]|uniref:TIGR01212 family radical SAM protein n=1 Tax=Lagierella massiliensis TaxID=1689303 RepID=UPI001E2FCE91|nr:TIGR01212 family radical SAM protein [Lagierella massiliensis]
MFCGDEGAGEFAGSRRLSITEQIDSQIKFLKHKSKSDKYIAYFQSFTNTFAPVEVLRKKYYEALNHPNIVGISIATRPDCIDEDIRNLLSEISNQYETWVELGFQTSNEETAKIINRGYENSIFKEQVLLLHNRGIKTITHIIFGLPFETHEDFMNTVKYINGLPIWGVKFHSLYIYEDSPLYKYYLNTMFKIIEREEYIDAVCDAIEILRQDIIIHRITGDPDKNKLFKPIWPKDKIKVIGNINKELKERDIMQGNALSRR